MKLSPSIQPYRPYLFFLHYKLAQAANWCDRPPLAWIIIIWLWIQYFFAAHYTTHFWWLILSVELCGMLCSPGPATTLTLLAAWSGPAKASLELSRQGVVCHSFHLIVFQEHEQVTKVLFATVFTWLHFRNMNKYLKCCMSQFSSDLFQEQEHCLSFQNQHTRVLISTHNILPFRSFTFKHYVWSPFTVLS